MYTILCVHVTILGFSITHMLPIAHNPISGIFSHFRVFSSFGTRRYSDKQVSNRKIVSNEKCLGFNFTHAMKLKEGLVVYNALPVVFWDVSIFPEVTKCPPLLLVS